MGNPFVLVLLLFEIIACFSGIYHYKKVKEVYFQHFVFYLSYIVLAEIVGTILLYEKRQETNLIFYNFFVIPVEFCFFYYLFFASHKKNKIDLLPVFCGTVYLVSLLADIFYFRFHIHSYVLYYISYTIGNLLLLVLILRFFLRLINSDEILSFKKNQLFWISLGLLIFYLISFPYYPLLYNYLNKDNEKLFIYYRDFTDILNIFMYFIFAISFIWGRRTDS